MGNGASSCACFAAPDVNPNSRASSKTRLLDGSGANTVIEVSAVAQKPAKPFFGFNVVDDKGAYQNDAVKNCLETRGIHNRNDYLVIAVMGAQNTGKSTLLNNVFGTPFDMHAEDVVDQCTKGIWADVADTKQTGKEMPVLVLDLEGCDGIERDQNKDFERQLALFGYVAADVLILNLNASNVGQCEGAGVTLIATILQEKLKLLAEEARNQRVPRVAATGFAAASANAEDASSGGITAEEPLLLHASTLLVVFRNVELPVHEKIQKKYMRPFKTTLEHIWEKLKKPDELAGRNFEEIFKVHFYGLPDYTRDKPEFLQGCIQLAKDVLPTESGAPATYQAAYYHNTEYTTDMYVEYLAQLWQNIRSNQALNLPGTMDLIHKEQCEKLKDQQFQMFKEDREWLALKQAGSSGSIKDFKLKMDKLISTHVKGFEIAAKYCKDDLSSAAASQLLEDIEDEVFDVFDNLVASCITHLEEDYKKVAIIPDGIAPSDLIARVIEEYKVKFLGWWDVTLPEGAFKLARRYTAAVTRLSKEMSAVVQELHEQKVREAAAKTERLQMEHASAEKIAKAQRETEAMKKKLDEASEERDRLQKEHEQAMADDEDEPGTAAFNGQEKSGGFVQKLVDVAIGGLGPVCSAHQLAQEYLGNKSYYDNHDRCKSLIKMEAAKSFASGFAAGLGGFSTMAISVPADVLAATCLQARAVAAIAVILGHDINDDRVRSMVLMTLLGEAMVTEVLRTVGINIGKKAAMQALKQVPGKALMAINKQVGFRLLTKFGSKGAVNLVSWIPIFGGLVGGGVNASSMASVGNLAIKVFARS